MKIILGRKQKYKSDEPWHDAVAHIEQLISAEECETFAAAAINRITDAAAGKNAGYAWSGGKDSLVLADLCQRAGIMQCALFLTKLEFPAFESWLLEHKPDGCEVLRFDFDLDYSYLGVDGTLELLRDLVEHTEHPVPSDTEIVPMQSDT